MLGSEKLQLLMVAEGPAQNSLKSLGSMSVLSLRTAERKPQVLLLALL